MGGTGTWVFSIVKSHKELVRREAWDVMILCPLCAAAALLGGDAEASA